MPRLRAAAAFTRAAWIVPLATCALALGGCRLVGSPRISLYEENDSLTPGGGTDRYYTQGLRVAAVYMADEQPELADAIGALPAPQFRGELPGDEMSEVMKVGVSFGQDMYTPACINAGKASPVDGKDVCDRPMPDDRPYAGWLYVGALQASQWFAPGDDRAGDVQISKQLDVGVIGPASVAQNTQVSFHHLIDAPRPLGWKYQLKDEPGIDAVYDYRRRVLWQGDADGFGVDLIPAGLVSLGNVDTHVEIGGAARAGWKLPRDFGVSTIQTSAIEGKVDASDETDVRCYVFGGAVGRAVLRNVFLDGNTFRSGGPSVDKKIFVGELRAGVAVELGSFHVAYTMSVRSIEFTGQRGSQQWGSLQVGYSADF